MGSFTQFPIPNKAVNEVTAVQSVTDSDYVLVLVDGSLKKVPKGAIGGGGSGMENPMTASGDIIIGGTSGTPTRLPKGTDGKVLTMVNGAVAWADLPLYNGGVV